MPVPASALFSAGPSGGRERCGIGDASGTQPREEQPRRERAGNHGRGR